MKSAYIRFGGALQLSLLLASSLVPQVLDWRAELAPLNGLFRQLIWVHGGYVVLTIVGLGLVALIHADRLHGGDPLGRFVAGFIAVFWGCRLLIQLFVFDATDHLTTWWLAAGYQCLTLIFVYLTVVFAIATFTTATAPRTEMEAT